MSLSNKKIVVCRRREQSRKMVLALQKKRAWPIVFPTFRLEPLAISGQDLPILEKIENFDWLILGSANGVHFFYELLKLLTIPVDKIAHLSVGVVGRKTEQQFKYFFPGVNVRFCANYLSELLQQIDADKPGIAKTLINPTSRQSLQNIKIENRENINLTRLPIYQSVPDLSNDPAEIEFVKSGKYEGIYFGSPSAFDYFLQLADAQVLSGNIAIFPAGKTTAGHITERGYPVAEIPVTAQVPDVVNAMETYFSDSEKK